jgi:hypothetical protein
MGESRDKTLKERRKGQKAKRRKGKNSGRKMAL